jgi:hypothetical protein
MKEIIQKSIIAIFCLFFITCKKEINEPEHKNTGRNIMYVEFDGKKYLFEEKSFTFYKNIKAKIKPSEDDIGGLPQISIDDSFLSLQGVIHRTDKFGKRKGNSENQFDGFDFYMTAIKDNNGKWILKPDRQFSFVFVYSYIPWNFSDYDGYGDGSYYQFSPKNDSKLTINVLNIDMQKKTISFTLKGTVVGENTTKQIYIYMDVQWSY